MPKGEKIQIRKPAGDDLEPYRRLLEIQKQLVRMSQEHEQTKRECQALRQRAAREWFEAERRKGTLRHRVRRSAFKLLKRLPRLTAAELFRMANNKQTSSC